MSIAISGLEAARMQLETASHNLTNAQTVGYKEFRDVMSDVYGASEVSNVNMAGVSRGGTQQQFTQGQLTSTGNAFDMGIEGAGYFTLSSSGSLLYSRAGYFHLDKDNYLVNPTGMRLQGFKIDELGQVNRATMGDLQAMPKTMPGKATSDVSAVINLDASSSVINRQETPFKPANPASYHWYCGFKVFDSLGQEHLLGNYFTKIAVNQWEIASTVDDLPAITPPATITFNPSGQLENPETGRITLDSVVLPDSGAEDLNLNMDFSTATQFAADHSIQQAQTNGQMPGSVTRVTLSNDGFLEATYNNGKREKMGQIAIATFPSDAGLVVNGDNTWRSTIDSGNPFYNPSGINGAGKVRSGSLEQSNVEVSRALADIMVAQRNFQMSAKVFKSEDVLQQALINITN